MTLLKKLSTALGLAILGTTLSMNVMAQDTRPQTVVEAADGPGDVRLPDTASPLPILAMCGMLAITGGFIVRSRKRQR